MIWGLVEEKGDMEKLIRSNSILKKYKEIQMNKRKPFFYLMMNIFSFLIFKILHRDSIGALLNCQEMLRVHADAG